MLQSRGSYLSMDRSIFRERHFNLLKSWVEHFQDIFLEKLEDRYIVYGEWMGALHSVFYDHLPHLFLEFDVWDRREGCFLSTQARHELLKDTPVKSVPIIHQGEWTKTMNPKDFIGPSLFRTEGDEWLENLKLSCQRSGDDFEKRLSRLYRSNNVEGLYLKREEGGRVVERAKWVQGDFVQTIMDADVHWQSTFVVPNMLGGEVEGLYGALVRAGGMGGDYDALAPMGWQALSRPGGGPNP